MLRFISIILLFCNVVLSCKSNENYFSSKNIDEPSKRIERLKEYYNLKSEIIDTEFEIFDVNYNANRSIPGPTNRDYKIVVLVKPEYIDDWTNEFTITSFPLNYDWVDELIKDNNNFNIYTSPMMYTGVNKELILFEKEGIILIRIKQD